MEKELMETPEWKLACIADMADEISEVISNLDTLDVEASTVTKIDEAYNAISVVHKGLVVQLEEAASVDSGTQAKRLATLARLGLVDRNVIPTLSKLLKALDDEKAVLTATQRKNALKLLNGLIDLVTGDLLFNKAVSAERQS